MVCPKDKLDDHCKSNFRTRLHGNLCLQLNLAGYFLTVVDLLQIVATLLEYKGIELIIVCYEKRGRDLYRNVTTNEDETD